MKQFCHWKNTNCIIHLFYISYQSLNVNIQVIFLFLHQLRNHISAVYIAYKYIRLMQN